MKEINFKSNFMRDWKIGVLAFAVGLVLLSVFAWRIFLSDQIAGGYLAPQVTSLDSSIKSLDQKKLQVDILLLETKQADYLKLKANPPKVIDPSL